MPDTDAFAKRARTYESRAQTYFVADDRWNQRWVFTPYWALRLDVARRVGGLPTEPGIWQNKKPATGRWTPKMPPKPHQFMRHAIRPGFDYSGLEPVIHRGEQLIVSNAFRDDDAGNADYLGGVWRRSTGGYTFVNPKFMATMRRRLPDDVTLRQAAPKTEWTMRGREVPRAIAFVLDGAAVGLLMPLIPCEATLRRVGAALGEHLADRRAA